MSLEDKIQGLTDAVNALTAVLAHPVLTVKGDPELPKPEKESLKTKPSKSLTDSSTATESAATPPAAVIAPAKPEPVTASPSNTIDYAQVAKAITDTFKVDRAKTIAALAKFGAAKGPQLKKEDYAAFLKELTA